jgi:ABC-2 type transport system permease protein
MSDLWTMLWKESKDLIFQGGWAQWLRPLVIIGAVGVALPLRAGEQWLALPPGVMLVILFVPFLFILSFIGDAIAGERERHTLETLLATRMPDRVILLGKIIVTVGYAWGMTLLGLLLSPVVVNLSVEEGSRSDVFYHPLALFLEALVLGPLISLLAANAGVLVSLRVATVRQAQQILIVGMMVLLFAVLFALGAVPADLFAALSYFQIMLIAIAVVAILDVILLGVALVSFQRSRLILD